jgi:hypothetical protein
VLGITRIQYFTGVCYSNSMHKKCILIVTILFLAAAPQFASALLMMPTSNPQDVETQVKNYFQDAPVMVQIAKCESGFRQFDKSLMPLRGGQSKTMIGVFQINEAVHAETAKKMGMDIYSLEGNLAYARHLYNRSGTGPWAPCVPDEKLLAVPTETKTMSAKVPNATLTVNLSFGFSHPEVATLQKILNAKGFTIATSGPGSPGNETVMFGQLTRDALRKFQCSSGIACAGSESTTGYGRLGPVTRAALLK